MGKKYLIAIGIIILILIIIAFYPKDNFIIVDNEKILIEIADNDLERQEGLMYRTELCDDCGMLFVFEQEDFHSFWMKNTYIPLDIVFINSELKIVEVLHAVPCEREICESYIPKEKAKYVLEVNHKKFDERVVGGRVDILATLTL